MKAIIFDCDGVLVDSEVLACRVVASALAVYAPAIDAEALTRSIAGRADQDVMRELADTHGAVFPADMSRRLDLLVDEAFESQLRAIPGIHAALGRLSLPCAVASNGPLHRVTRSLTTTGLVDFFNGYVFSAEMVDRPKPAPDVYLLAASKRQARPDDCIVVEDTITGVAAAKAAGMTVVGFTGGGHTWPQHADNLVEAGADLILDHMDGLDEAIDRLMAVCFGRTAAR